jgi:MYXO-CTERM domain-containing protein
MTAVVVQIALAVLLLLPAPVWAGVEDWRINEVVAEADGDPSRRYVELTAPPSAEEDNCLFPSSRLEVLDADGAVVWSHAPFMSTVCFTGETFLLFATTEAEAYFGFRRDGRLDVPLPPAGGQVCFTSSLTRYDCARWGTVATPVVDFFGQSDLSAAPAIARGTALARIDDTDVVADDFVLKGPTPGGPNFGPVFEPPDAGPPDAAIPDAAIFDASPDAEPADAAPRADAFERRDATPRPDAREPPAWLVAEPGGGSCDCRVGGGGGEGGQGAWLLAALLGLVGLSCTRSRR